MHLTEKPLIVFSFLIHHEKELMTLKEFLDMTILAGSRITPNNSQHDKQEQHVSPLLIVFVSLATVYKLNAYTFPFSKLRARHC